MAATTSMSNNSFCLGAVSLFIRVRLQLFLRQSVFLVWRLNVLVVYYKVMF